MAMTLAEVRRQMAALPPEEQKAARMEGSRLAQLARRRRNGIQPRQPAAVKNEAEVPRTSQRGVTPDIAAMTRSTLRVCACGMDWQSHVKVRHPAPKPGKAGVMA